MGQSNHGASIRNIKIAQGIQRARTLIEVSEI